MGDYKLKDARFTMIVVRLPKRNGEKGRLYKVLPFELVRFNVDENPDAPQVIVPVGEGRPQKDKIYERIWMTDTVPYKDKVSFGEVL